MNLNDLENLEQLMRPIHKEVNTTFATSFIARNETTAINLIMESYNTFFPKNNNKEYVEDGWESIKGREWGMIFDDVM